MKLMISFVGKSDPISNRGEGALVTLAQKIRPDRILLFVTYDPDLGTEESILNHLEDTYEWLTDDTDGSIRLEEIHEFRTPLKDPRDYETILAEVQKDWLSYEKHLPDTFETWINLSSGTPQQQAALLLLSDNGLFPDPHLCQVAPPQYAETEGERIKEIDTRFVREKNIILECRSYLNDCLFGAAARKMEELHSFTKRIVRRTQAEFYGRFLRGLRDWDLFRYREAHRTLSRLYDEYRGIDELEDICGLLGKQVDVLGELRSETEKETVHNLIDLYFNTARCFARGEHTQTLSRFYRLIEGFYYHRLRARYDVEPSDLHQSENKQNARRISGGLNGNRLEFWKAGRALVEVLEDNQIINLQRARIEVPAGSGMKESSVEDRLNVLREVRNESLAQHGMKPVNKNQAEAAMIVARRVLSTFNSSYFGDGKRQYPFSPEAVLDVAEMIKKL